MSHGKAPVPENVLLLTTTIVLELTYTLNKLAKLPIHPITGASSASMLGRSLLGFPSNRDRHADPLARLRFVIETMPGSRKYLFTPSTRKEVLSELYAAFWGQYSHLFLPPAYGGFTGLLSDAQRHAFGPEVHDRPIPGIPCGKIFKKGDGCYRCRDCAIDDSCVFCADCFHATDHAGHNVTFYLALQPGGVCDCGEAEAWKTPVTCRLHPLPETLYGAPKVSSTSRAAIVDQWAIRNRATVPHDLRDTMSRTVAYALDFVLDTLDYSPEETTVPEKEEDLKKQTTMDPLGHDLYSVVVWNDEKHSFDEAIQHVGDAVGRHGEPARDYVEQIDVEGRAVIEVTSSIPRALGIARQIANIDLGVTVRRGFDTFREQLSSVIIEWLMDLTQCRLSNDAIVLREVIAAEVYAPRKKDSSSLTTNIEASKVYLEIKDAARLDWLLLYYVRLWKRPRLNLKHILVSLLTINHEHRLTLAVHFANIYHRIIDSYLLVDREAETSIKYFAVQVFTVPSVAAYIVRHNRIITTLLGIIKGFFTNCISNKRILATSDTHRRVDVDSFPFRSKRFMPVFSDLRYICTNQTIQELIAIQPEHIAQFISVCQLFMGINPNKRMATSHVEYETESWISVFNVTLSLSRVVKVYGEAFAHSDAAALMDAIHRVIRAILSTCTLTDDQLDKSKYTTIAFHKVEFGEIEYQILSFDVLNSWVSFHHSLHWLLAELFKHVDILSEESLKTIHVENLRDLVVKQCSDRAILTIADFPLRVIAMVAQIRTGLWVRNGFAIRGQLLHYRDFMLRELCYDQDLFIVQSMFVILNPDIMMISMLDRFQLLFWFSGATSHPYYEGAQLYGMIEELLYLIITCVSEFGNARRLSPADVVRREVIHGLALGPCSFTELCKRVAERIMDDSNLDRALRTIANYKPPDGSSDHGVYELKEELFDEVNPFYFHYTRNRREEVESILKARLKKKTGEESPVIIPKPMAVESGPFTTLPLAFHSEVLLQILFYTFYNIIRETTPESGAPPSADAAVDQAIHLVMLALVEQPQTFAHIAAKTSFEKGSSTLLDVLCTLEYHEQFKSFRPRVQWCLDQLTKEVPDEIQSRRQVPEAHKKGDASEAKRRAAKARQAAIMQQFATAQKNFLDQFDDEDDEDLEAKDDAPEDLGPCIVCQDTLDSMKPYGVLGFIQPSRLIKRVLPPQSDILRDILGSPISLDQQIPAPPAAEGPSDRSVEGVAPFGILNSEHTRFGLHGSVCGHLMHLECFQTYSYSIEQRHIQQPTRNHPEVVERKEFLCPLCKSLGNIILPVHDRPLLQLDATLASSSGASLADWMRNTSIELYKSENDRKVDALQHQNGTGEFVFWNAEDNGPFYPTLKPGGGVDEDYQTVQTVRDIIAPLSDQTLHLHRRVPPPNGQRGRGMYVPEELVAYTIQAIEISQRGVGAQGKVIVDNINEATLRSMRGLISMLAKRALMEPPFPSREWPHRIKQAICRRLLPDWTTDPKCYHPLLLRDPLTIVVEIAAVAPEILHHVVALAYYACLGRTAIGLVSLLSSGLDVTELPSAEPQFSHLFGDVGVFVLSVCRHSPVLERTAESVLKYVGDGRFERLLYAHTLPFLRCALLLTHAVRPFPSTSSPDPFAPEYSRLLHLLQIPPLAEISNHDHLRGAMAAWCASFGALHTIDPSSCSIILDLPSVYRLARLPRILDTMFNDASKALKCTRCHTVPSDPAICMICGMVCCHQSHCCVDIDDRKQGECNMHMRECGGPIGMYFLVKRCMVLYLYAGSGSFTQPPYLDVHGEFDYLMRRGRRQYLHIQRYEDVRKTWLTHGIATFTARKLDTTMDSGGWDSL